jgi:hypothetical protein
VSEAVRNIAAASLALNYPTLVSIPHSVINGYKNVLALTLELENYSFPLADKVCARVSVGSICSAFVHPLAVVCLCLRLSCWLALVRTALLACLLPDSIAQKSEVRRVALRSKTSWPTPTRTCRLVAAAARWQRLPRRRRSRSRKRRRRRRIWSSTCLIRCCRIGASAFAAATVITNSPPSNLALSCLKTAGILK